MEDFGDETRLLDRENSFRKGDLAERTVSCFMSVTVMVLVYNAAWAGLSGNTRLRKKGIGSPEANDCGAGIENLE